MQANSCSQMALLIKTGFTCAPRWGQPNLDIIRLFWWSLSQSLQDRLSKLDISKEIKRKFNRALRQKRHTHWAAIDEFFCSAARNKFRFAAPQLKQANPALNLSFSRNFSRLRAQVTRPVCPALLQTVILASSWPCAFRRKPRRLLWPLRPPSRSPAREWFRRSRHHQSAAPGGAQAPWPAPRPRAHS